MKCRWTPDKNLRSWSWRPCRLGYRQHLESSGYRNIITRRRFDLDLTGQAAVDKSFSEERPEYVFLAAAKVGGILANSNYPADFIRDNLAIELNVIDSAYRHGTTKLQFLGSSCIYPKFAPQPMKEEHLLTGALEPTNEWYAIAKIAGIKLCQAYRAQYGFNAISLMPTNLYGPGDNFDLENFSRAPRADPQISRSQNRTAARSSHLGHRRTQARVSPRGRLGRRGGISDAALR